MSAIAPLPDDLVLTPRSRWPLELDEETVRAVLARPLPQGPKKIAAAAITSSIVIVTYNKLVCTRLCLESLLGPNLDASTEVIVVDNDSRDGTVDYLRALAAADSRVRCRFNRENRGFAAAVNQGLELARGEILVLLNNDTAVAPGWLQGLSRHLRDPAVGLVGPVTNRCANEAQIETDYRTYGEFLRVARARARQHRGEVMEIPMPAMFCVALRRSAQARIGPLDERFEAGLFEDEDYALRARNAGYRLLLAEDVLVHHFGQASIGELAASGEYGALFHANRRRFEHKWNERWRPPRRRAEAGYRRLISTIRETVDRVVPVTATVLVASRGDEDLLVLGGRRAWHFPQAANGEYAGHHPADGEAAIAHLRQLERAGGEYLLLPNTAFWWLQYYAEFARHLSASYACAWRDDDCLIYRLTTRDEMAPGPPEPTAELHGPPLLEAHLVTVLVPVHEHHDALERCLDRLVRHTRHPYRLLLVDDASDDPRVWPLIQSFVCRHRHACALRHARRLGWAASVAEGCRRAPGDVALLDPAAEVTAGWLEKLTACAGAHDDAAGASPLTVGNPPSTLAERLFALSGQTPPDAAAASVDAGSERTRPSVPVAAPHCVYLRRRALHRIGFPDPARFPGPDSVIDLSLRAAAGGLRLLLDEATVIGHRPASAGIDERALERVHPGYAERVTRWLEADPLAARRTVDPDAGTEDGQNASPRPAVLIVVHAGAGGASFAARDLACAMADEFRCLLLKTALRKWTLYEYWAGDPRPTREYRFGAAWRLHKPLDRERLAVLAELCDRSPIRLAHVHHLLGNGPDLLAALEARSIPIVFSLHDFYPVCPTAHLLDDQGRYCAGVCSPGAGDCPLDAEYFPGPMPVLKHRYVHRHRAQMARALARCERLIAPSKSSAELLNEFFPLPADVVSVIGHGRDLERRDLAVVPRPGTRARLICPGDLGQAKGAALIAELLALNAAAGAPFEFHFVGRPARGSALSKAGGICHGPYRRTDFLNLVERIGASFSLLASICAETFSYTLTESWAAGLPVFATRLGALDERIGRHGGGWLFEPDDPGAFFDGMHNVLCSPAEYRRQRERIAAIDLPDVAATAKRVADVYRAVAE